MISIIDNRHEEGRENLKRKINNMSRNELKALMMNYCDRMTAIIMACDVRNFNFLTVIMDEEKIIKKLKQYNTIEGK